jgi:hypothetical protein
MTRFVEARRAARPAAVAALACIPLTVALAVVTGVAVQSQAAGPPTPLAVSETNRDADGLIRVHEQGVADTRVTNLPVNENGDLRVAGGSRSLVRSTSATAPA